MAALWLYTGLRFGLALVLFAILWLLGVGGLLGVALAIVLSMPLSYVLLAKPRAALSRTIEQRIEFRRARDARLSQELQGDPTDSDGSG